MAEDYIGSILTGSKATKRNNPSETRFSIEQNPEPGTRPSAERSQEASSSSSPRRLLPPLGKSAVQSPAIAPAGKRSCDAWQTRSDARVCCLAVFCYLGGRAAHSRRGPLRGLVVRASKVEAAKREM